MSTEHEQLEQLQPEELNAEELAELMEHMVPLGVLMAKVYERRGERPFNYDGMAIMVNPEDSKLARVHLHMCVQPGDAVDAALLDGVDASTVHGAGPLQ